jgi:hypothetical protein
MGIKEQLKELEDKVTMGLELSYKKLLEYKKQKNSPLIISKEGKIVEVPVNGK